MRILDGTAAVCVEVSSFSAKAGHWDTGKAKGETPGTGPIKRKSEDLHYCYAVFAARRHRRNCFFRTNLRAESAESQKYSCGDGRCRGFFFARRQSGEKGRTFR